MTYWLARVIHTLTLIINKITELLLGESWERLFCAQKDALRQL